MTCVVVSAVMEDYRGGTLMTIPGWSMPVGSLAADMFYRSKAGLMWK